MLALPFQAWLALDCDDSRRCFRTGMILLINTTVPRHQPSGLRARSSIPFSFPAHAWNEKEFYLCMACDCSSMQILLERGTCSRALATMTICDFNVTQSHDGHEIGTHLMHQRMIKTSRQLTTSLQIATAHTIIKFMMSILFSNFCKPAHSTS